MRVTTLLRNSVVFGLIVATAATAGAAQGAPGGGGQGGSGGGQEGGGGGGQEAGRTAPAGADWPVYRGNLAGTGASTLTQITRANVDQLEPAWTYDLTPVASGADVPGPNSQVTPIVVDGIMYVPTADRVAALDPVTGTERWSHRVPVGRPSRRGVTYWPGDDEHEARIFYTAGTQLAALRADDGRLVSDFGQDGLVDMGVPYNSVPLAHGNVLVVGANTPRGTIGGIGNARAFDARTGDARWEFDSVPDPGAVGNDTWAGDSWRDRLGANAWPFYFTIDAERGLLFLPLASPIPGEYGGDRAGDNLFGNSLVAVDIETGAYVWHFQTIHHDLWDWDPPAPPTLFDIAREDGVVPALGVTTKSGYLYLLHRETGEPIYGVEERPVPQSDVPGEQTSPTQPIPVRPPPMAKVRFDPADVVTADDTTAEHAAACRALLEEAGALSYAGPFTPWVYRAPGSGPRSTILFPGLVGGPNWGGIAADPATGYLFVFSREVGSIAWLEDADDGYPVPYRRTGPRPNTFDVDMGGQRWPCHQPPWGQLTAVDSATGDVVWKRPVGVTDGLPADRQETGRPGRAGAIVTATGLLFIGSTDDNRFRALDARTGRDLWVTTLEGRANANPMTYEGADGRQYVAVSATNALVAFALR